MFIGHHAAAFAAKRIAPRASLGTLMAAAMFLDLLWPILTLAGVEHFRVDPGNTAYTPLAFDDYPITHSLAMALVWSLLAAVLYAIARKSRRDAVVVGVAVLSHWILDFVTHRPDLALWPGGPKVGLGLWSSVAGTIVVESTLFAIGVFLYLRATKARDRIGSVALWSLIAFLVVIDIANIASPPPPSWRAVAYTALAAWLFVPWAWWIDRHRQAHA
jgi:hypothetical protein